MSGGSSFIPRNACRYAVDQVLRGIQAFVWENCGPEIVLYADKPLYDYAAPAADSHECPLAFLEDLAAYFGFQWSEQRWSIWLQLRSRTALSKRERKEVWDRWQREVAPNITVRDLAVLIARKAPAQSIAPVTILGTTCVPAGVFLGICDMPEVRGRRLAPSTSLRTLRSSNKICDLWTRLEWVSGVALPRTTKPTARKVTTVSGALLAATYAASILMGAAVGVIVWPVAGVGALFLAMAAAFVTLLIGSVAVDRLHNPLPCHVESFGDLARLTADKLLERDDYAVT